MANAAAFEMKRPVPGEAVIAITLLVTSLLQILVIAHHPHVRTADPAQVMREIVALSPLARFIHTFAIAGMFYMAFCLGEIVLPRISSRLGRAAGLVYAAGLVALLSAATVDGWVLERLMETLTRESVLDLAGNARLVHLCMAWVVSSTNIGIVMTSIGIVIASVGLLRNGWHWQIGGALGVFAGAMLTLAILDGRLTMDGHGVLIGVLLQASWVCVIGIVSLASSSGWTAKN